MEANQFERKDAVCIPEPSKERGHAEKGKSAQDASPVSSKRHESGVKVKYSWEVVEIGTRKNMIAKWFAMTTNYLPVIYWKQYFQQYTWSLSEWVQNQGHTFTLRHCSCFPGLRSSTICPLSAGGMGVTTPSLNGFPIMGLNLWRPCFHLDCIFLKTIEVTSVIVTKGKGPQGLMFLKLIIGDKTLITHWVRISRCPWGYLGIMDVLGKCRQGSNSNV